MRFVIQSSIYLVLIAILLHAALAIPLPAPQGQPGFLKDTKYSIQAGYHGWRASRNGQNAELQNRIKDYQEQQAREHRFLPVRRVDLNAAKRAERLANDHEDRQKDHLEKQAKYLNKRKGKPA